MKILAVFLYLAYGTFVCAQPQPPAAPIEVSPATKEVVKRKVTLTGTIFPRTKSVLASEVEGRVEKRFVEEGDFVKKGAGQLFKDIAVAVSCSVALSLLVSVTVIPSLSARILSVPKALIAPQALDVLTRSEDFRVKY